MDLAFNFHPFVGLAGSAIALVYAANFLGFFVRGAFGFGSNLPIVLLTTWVLGPHHAIVLTVLTALVAQTYLLPQGLRSADWTVARPLMLGMVAGTAAGTWLFALLSGRWLSLLMGVLIVITLALSRVRPPQRLVGRARLRSRRLALSLAALASAAGTVSGGGGMYALVVYLRLACATATALRGTSLLLSTLFMLARVGFVALAGFVSTRLLAETAALLPMVFLGTWTGIRFFHSTSSARFYAGLQIVLLGAALALIAKAIDQLI